MGYAGGYKGGTIRQSDSYLLSRENHTGTQAISTIDGLQDALDSKQANILKFEYYSKNIQSYNSTLNYTDGLLTSIDYTFGVNTITKTLSYTDGVLTSIILSGDIPDGLTVTTKTLNYTGGELTGITYS